MKKIFSMVLILLMILSSLTTAFGTEGDPPALKPGILISPKPITAPSDVAGTSYEEAVRALMAAKIVSGYTDGTYRPANTLTRAEACAFLVNYLAPTEEERNAAPDSGFSDVSGWATTFVNYAVEKGIVAGYKDGTFRPANKVNYQELAAMTVNTLGIDPQTLVGGWPDAYINKAKELGMYENISVSKKNQDEANRGDVAEMIYSLIKYKDTSAKDAAIQRLVKSNAVLADAESMSYSTLTDMKMSSGGETIATTMITRMDMIMDPLMMHMTAAGSSDGELQSSEYYYMTEGNELVMYIVSEDQWYKMSMGEVPTAAMPENPVAEMGVYLEAYDNLRVEGKDAIGGKSATKLYCELGEAYMETMLEELDLAEQFVGGLGEAEMEMVYDMMQTMKGFGYYIWIDDETEQLVKISMDMKGLMQEMMSTIMDVAIEAAVAQNPEITPEEIEALYSEVEMLNVDKMLMEIHVTNMDAIDGIELPVEAKNAIDLGGAV